MNSLKFATFLLVVAWTLPPPDAGAFDLPAIRAEGGQVYRDILILDSDGHGLLFRHRDGIAKVPFAQLSDNVRMLYEPVAEVTATGEAEAGKGGEPAVVADDSASEDWVLTMTTRTRVTLPVSTLSAGTCSPAARGFPWRGYAAWPSHWPRYHQPWVLAYPGYRACALDELLHVTGLDGAYGWYPRPRRVIFPLRAAW